MLLPLLGFSPSPSTPAAGSAWITCPEEKASVFQSLRFPMRSEERRSQQRRGRVPARARDGLGEERRGGKEGREDGATLDSTGKAVGWLSPDLRLHPCVGHENSVRGENISTQPLNDVNDIRKQFEWKFSCTEEFKRIEICLDISCINERLFELSNQPKCRINYFKDGKFCSTMKYWRTKTKKEKKKETSE